MSEPQPRSRSPWQRAMARLLALRSARVGLYLLAVYALLGLYAPFIASDIALLWWDDDGLRLPILASLFNRFVYTEHHDFFFNVMALALPPVLIAARWGPWPGRRMQVLRYGLAAAVALAVIGMLPLAWLVTLTIAAALVTVGLWTASRLQRGAAGLRIGVIIGAAVVVLVFPRSWISSAALWRERGAPDTTFANLVNSRQLAEHGLSALESGDTVLHDDGRRLRLLFHFEDDDGTMQWQVRAVGQRGGTSFTVTEDDIHLIALRMALFPPVPHRFERPYRGAVLAGPGQINEDSGRRFWLGTDATGRDVFARLCFGARISLTIGVLATLLSMGIGIVIGAVSGYWGGWVDLLLQRLVEIMMNFPTFLLVLVVIAMVGRDLMVIILVFGLTGWAGTARLVRGEFLALAGREYVLAAEALGFSKSRIMFRHMLPNALTPLIISAAFGVAGTVLGESGLAFLGLVEARTPSWGLMLSDGRNNPQYYHIIYVPGLAIFGLVTALNLIGNGLREALDTRSEGAR